MYCFGQCFKHFLTLNISPVCRTAHV